MFSSGEDFYFLFQYFFPISKRCNFHGTGFMIWSYFKITLLVLCLFEKFKKCIHKKFKTTIKNKCFRFVGGGKWKIAYKF